MVVCLKFCQKVLPETGVIAPELLIYLTTKDT